MSELGWGWGSRFSGERAGLRAGTVWRKVPFLAHGPQQSQLWHQALVGTAVLTLCPVGLCSQEGILPMSNRLKHPLNLPNGCNRAGATCGCLLAVPWGTSCAPAVTLCPGFPGRRGVISEVFGGLVDCHQQLPSLKAEMCFPSYFSSSSSPI